MLTTLGILDARKQQTFSLHKTYPAYGAQTAADNGLTSHVPSKHSSLISSANRRSVRGCERRNATCNSDSTMDVYVGPNGPMGTMLGVSVLR